MANLKESLVLLKSRSQRVLDFDRNTMKSAKEKLDSTEFLESRLKLLEKYWEQLDSQFQETLRLLSAEDEQPDYFTSDQFAVVESAYVDAMSRLEMRLNQLHPVVSHGADARDASQQPQQPQQQVIKVKPIEPPLFSGDIIHWMGFRDLFSAIIIDNRGLSNSQRLQYLQMSCKGEASELIRDITVDDANFRVAWGLLERRFDNPRIVVSRLLEQLLQLKVMQSNSSSELKILLDGTNRVIRSLTVMRRPTEFWDDLLVAITVSKLDINTRLEWEKSISATTAIPTFEALDRFMSAQLRTYEALPTTAFVTSSRQLTSSSSRQQPTPSSSSSSRTVRAHAIETRDGCSVCNEPRSHAMYCCPKFNAMNLQERKNVVSRMRACFNCLNSTHMSWKCSNQQRCRTCGNKHHTLLHDPSTHQTQPSASAFPTSTPSETAAPAVVHGNVVNEINCAPMLLGTAKMNLFGCGRMIVVRALIDSGAHRSFISEDVVKHLKLKRVPTNTNLFGVGGTQIGTGQDQVNVSIAPIAGGLSIVLRPLVLPQVTGRLPTGNIPYTTLPFLRGEPLADDGYAESSAVDLLLGADVYPKIMLNEMRRSDDARLLAQKTIYGWILTGGLPMLPEEIVDNGQVLSHHVMTLDEQLRMFWELEESQDGRSRTPDENECERKFYETVRRESDGRLTVSLPFRSSLEPLGESRRNAERRLLQMERRFVKNEELKRMYSEFMSTYLRMGHMELVSPSDTATNAYFLPHHAVLKPSSTSTKLRVVFDASMPTSSGKSLNDTLMVGPRLQDDLAPILMRWRRFKVAVTADVEKMFRQVWVAADCHKFQRIVWRWSADEQISEYNLKTITYGTACAPYLAVKAMQHLASEERDTYPLASAVVLRDFYMDDCLTGADNAAGAIELKNQLIGLMSSGGLTLLKWASNSSLFVNDLPTELRAIGAEKEIDLDSSIKTLGVRWFPAVDEFGFVVTMSSEAAPMTKRTVLSEIARLFDPLSLLAPVVISAKITMQMLWVSGCDWNDALPDNIAERWRKYRELLPSLEEIRIPRWLGMLSNSEWSIHAFCDASKAAYAACVYVRVVELDGHVRTQLLAAKSRVAPVKPISIPRLELCGALLLHNLINTVMSAFNTDGTHVTAWTDSMVVLAWLQGQANRWPVFIANRVGAIQSSRWISRWRHIPGVDNPADVASRGVLPDELKGHPLWWTGPAWLEHGEESWPKTKQQMIEHDVLEEKSTIIVNMCAKYEQWSLIERYSSLNKLTRVTAYCMRAARRSDGPLRAEEVSAALKLWIGRVQQEHFGEELQQLSAGTVLSKRSKLQSLQPFIDDAGLLRVGGRLKRAAVPYDEKHPWILPHDNTLVRLIVTDAHIRMFHAGPKSTIGQLQQRFWILGVRNTVKSVLRRCVVCFRCRPTREQQLMGELPPARTQQHRAFLHTAVDYAGPVFTRTAKGRGHTAHKSWIAVFLCLSSRAAHLELVSDMTTQAFVAAFKRFCARRGLCSDVYADNGTNFVGAERDMRAQLALCMNDEEWSGQLATDGTRFHFAPPGSPHFNGLAEAAVKIAKSALVKVIGETKLTFEEMSTLLAQVEAVMNSRPMHPITCSIDDTAALTPGHLLIGQPLTAIPEPSLLDINDGRLSRWQLVTKMFQHFWQRWRREVLHHAQQRTKWNGERKNVKIGEIVVICDENVPPSKWAMGRIIQTHPGSDGFVRVVTIKTATSELKRAVTKICVFPIDI